jgi:hypothetical protein
VEEADMKIETTKRFCGALLGVAGLLISAAATADWWGGHHKKQNDACYQTTQSMKSACQADAIDDFYVEVAKCLNTNEVRSCKYEVREEFDDAIVECREQSEGRNDLCDRLPDAGPYLVELDPEDFTGQCAGGNPWYPLVPGTVTTFVNEYEDDGETIIVQVLDETREIDGIEAVIVRDTVYEGLPDDYDNPGEPEGDRIEDTDDYFAVDNECNVWYLGEISQSFEDGYLTDLEGSFLMGEDGAKAGIVMPGNPMVGDVYRQEFALGDAEDAGEILSLATNINDEHGNPVGFVNPPYDCSDNMCLMTEDFIANEPDEVEFKYFRYGVGFIAEQIPSGEVVLRLIKEEVLP